MDQHTDLPISAARLAELAEPLGEEACAILTRILDRRRRKGPRGRRGSPAKRAEPADAHKPKLRKSTHIIRGLSTPLTLHLGRK
jgi:hypothetical protein